MKLLPNCLKGENAFVFLKKLSCPDIVAIEIVFHNVVDDGEPFFAHQSIKFDKQRNQSVQSDFVELEEVSVILKRFQIMFEMKGFELFQKQIIAEAEL